MDDINIKEFLETIPRLKCGYFVWAVISSLFIRIILSIFKARAHAIGETSKDGERGLIIFDKQGEKEWLSFSSKEFCKLFWKLFRRSFCSNSRNPIIDDHWIPFFVGLSEVLIFPVIFDNNQGKILAGWFAIKILGQWSSRNSRTAINRFLLGNILSIIASYFLWLRFL